VQGKEREEEGGYFRALNRTNGGGTGDNRSLTKREKESRRTSVGEGRKLNHAQTIPKGRQENIERRGVSGIQPHSTTFSVRFWLKLISRREKSRAWGKGLSKEISHDYNLQCLFMEPAQCHRDFLIRPNAPGGGDKHKPTLPSDLTT